MKKKKQERWTPLVPVLPDYIDSLAPEKEMWKNDIYTVLVNRGIETPVGYVTWLSIKRNDQRAARDWRHFQYIKNQLVGEENEGCELYPAESRLVDNANQFHLWVLEDDETRFPMGLTHGRSVTEKDVIQKGSVQRPFEEDMKPKDLKECEDKQQEMYNELLRLERMEKIAKS